MKELKEIFKLCYLITKTILKIFQIIFKMVEIGINIIWEIPKITKKLLIIILKLFLIILKLLKMFLELILKNLKKFKNKFKKSKKTQNSNFTVYELHFNEYKGVWE